MTTNCATGTIAPYVPSTDTPWNERRVAHLYNRMGFGATRQQIQDGLLLSPTVLVDQLVDGVINLPLATPPVWSDWTTYPIDDYTDFFEEIYQHRDIWTREWLTDMLTNGFRAKLTLFWHNHFVTEWDTYNCSAYMYEYHKLLQQYALGNFKDFVEAMGITPAMLLYLNGNLNIVGDVNENYARELMELFTMGADNGYTQNDIIQVARALTGYRIDDDSCQMPYFNPSYADSGSKTIFGQTGNWGYFDIHDLIFTHRQDEVATFICGKIYKHFVYADGNSTIINELATTFKNNNFDLAPVFRQLFKSAHFFDDATIGHLIKSPIDAFVGVYHKLGLTYNDDRLNEIAYYSYELGQELFEPVNVAGWEGHRNWLNENTLSRRWEWLGDISLYMEEPDLTTLVTLASDLSNNSNDPAVITQVFVDFVLAREFINADDYQIATDVFKADIPENYYDDGSWNLSWEEAKEQVRLLLDYLIRRPEFQLL